MSGYRMVYLTAADQDEAAGLGRKLVEAKLAACVNILGAIQSIYVWQGRVEQSAEVSLIVKTREDRVNALMNLVREQHSYDCPSIVALPLLEVSPDYAHWIDEQLDAS